MKSFGVKKVDTDKVQLGSGGTLVYGDGSSQSTAYRGYAGQFSSYVTQTTASATALNVVALATTEYSDGITVASNKITYANAGTYTFEFDAQVESADTTSRQDVYFFLRKNGTDVVGSTSSASVVINNGTVNGRTFVCSTHIITLAAGDYLELIWAATSTNVTLQYTAASVTGIVRPSTASISVASFLLK